MAEPIYSPGLEGVIAGETAISTIAGGLQYRGYSIEDLAEHATFEEVAHLLLHGGANEAVMEVLKEVGTAERAEAWIRDALAKKRRIMGFGHRVYKTGDPRAAYLRTLCRQLAVETGNQDMESMADTIETIVQNEKKLPPNLDWPSARLYYYMGLAIDLYTPLFVVSRVTGWSAHVIEQLDNNRLIRPRANYTGPGPRKWVPVAQR